MAACDVVVDADFPGGNIVVERIEGDRVFVRQDLRDTEGDWFYWHFRVRGAAGRTLTFEFTGSPVIGGMGPAVSADGGRTWEWLGTSSVVDSRRFTYAFAEDAGEVCFCFSHPYLESDLAAWLRARRASPHLRLEELCTSRTGRSVELIRLGLLDGQPAFRIALAARHHCCEMMANPVLEGVMETMLGDDESGAWLRGHVEAIVVPFADKDGVEDGDQGKRRRPRDHGRDYAGESLYPETRALRELLPAWSAGRLRLAVDVHCPWIRGKHNENIYQVGSSDEEIWRQQQLLGRILSEAQRGPLRYDPADDLPHGVDWNTSKNYEGGKSFSRWAASLPDVWLATSFEVPYALHHGEAVTPSKARAFGADLARAFRRYLLTRAER